MKWFRLETADGAVDDTTRRALRETAEGHPASAWS
jgi:hypothetical protein